MTFNEFMTWYCILGIATAVIGIWRYIRNKQNTEPDELTVLSWFLVWWVWLGWLSGRSIYLFFKKRKNNILK